MATASGYLMGSIPSADIATKLAARDIGNLRRAGSGNPGAANAAVVLGVGCGECRVVVASAPERLGPSADGRVAAVRRALVGHDPDQVRSARLQP